MRRNYLQLCQKAVRDARIPGGGPSQISGQTGELADWVEWIKEGYEQIQNRHDGGWRWLRSTFELTTVSGTDVYASSHANIEDDESGADLRFARWHIADRDDPPKIYLQSAGVGGETIMSYLSWESFKAIYKRGSQTPGRPVHITVDPQNRLVLGPSPNNTFIIHGDYYKGPQILADDEEYPEMPDQFHDLIVDYAMETYGYLEVAQEVLALATRRGGRLMAQLENNQLPAPKMAGPLA